MDDATVPVEGAPVTETTEAPPGDVASGGGDPSAVPTIEAPVTVPEPAVPEAGQAAPGSESDPPAPEQPAPVVPEPAPVAGPPPLVLPEGFRLVITCVGCSTRFDPAEGEDLAGRPCPNCNTPLAAIPTV